MLRFVCLVAALGGCWSATELAPEAPAFAPTAPPSVDLVAIHETTLSFVQTSPKGLVDRRSVSVPYHVEQLHFLGKDPVVLMPIDEHATAQLWHITPTGHTELAVPEAASWPAVDTTGFDHFDAPEWDLITTPNREIWLGRCEWGYMGEGSSCTEWVYLRLAPGPVVSERKAPPQTPSRFVLSVSPPPASSIQVALVEDPNKPSEPIYEDRHIARCARAGRTPKEYPDVGDREVNNFINVDHLCWLQNEPPMWSIERSDGCMDICTRTEIFEGCALSKRFENAELVEGPDNVFALLAHDRASVRWQGKQIGALDASIVAFVPR